jgi:hypothetical protein
VCEEKNLPKAEKEKMEDATKLISFFIVKVLNDQILNMKIFGSLFILLCSISVSAQTLEQLKDSASLFSPMPRNTSDLVPFVGGLPTFSSGTPFNDLEFTVFDTDYMDGENSGGDVFMPVDPADDFPGSNKVKLIRCILNTDLDANYKSGRADRVILGTAELPPFFLRGDDGIDNDYAVLLHFDFNFGGIQLKGQQSDYRLVYCTLADGCKTEGWYLFYTKGGAIDLIAFIFPCSTIEPAVSGNPPANTNPICNSDSLLSLSNPKQFQFAKPISTIIAEPQGVGQFGSKGKEVIGGMTTDAFGNVYLYGLTDGNLDGQSDAANEIFVAKIGPDGQRVWVTELAMKEGSYLKGGVTDAEFIYVCGRTLGNLPGFTNVGRWDGIILKLNLSDGQIVAMNQWGNAGIDGYGNITQDEKGNLYVSAQGSPAGPATTDPDYLVAKHRKSDLSSVWRVIEPTTATGFSASAEAWGGLTYVKPNGIQGERLIAAGWYIAAGGANAFASVYENLDAAAPTRPHSIIINSMGGVRADWIFDNVVDAQGNIYFCGATSGNFQGTHQGEGDAYIVKYSPQLTNPVFKQFGTPKSDVASRIELDANGKLLVTGFTYGNYAGNNADATLSTADIFVEKFDLGLNPLNKKQFGTPHEDRASATSLRNQRLFIGGMTEGAMVGTSNGSFDGYVVAINPDDLLVTKPTVSVEPEKQLELGQILVFPNPTSSSIYIQMEHPIEANFVLLNQLGQTLRSENVTSANLEMNLESLPSGAYYLKMTTAHQRSNVWKVVRY